MASAGLPEYEERFADGDCKKESWKTKGQASICKKSVAVVSSNGDAKGRCWLPCSWV